LQGTVVAPGQAQIGTVARKLRHEINYHGGHAGMGYTRTVVEVRGGEFFFVVMTLQSGRAPECKTANGVASIGKQTVSFDGGKIVLGVFPGP
jgi:hypothetical protein